MRKLPAAAIPAKAQVRVVLFNGLASALKAAMGDTEPVTVTIAKVHNATPRPGKITWDTKDHGSVEVSGAERFDVVSLS